MKTTHITLFVLAGFLMFGNVVLAAPRPRGPVEARHRDYRPDHRPGPKRIDRLPEGFVKIVFGGGEFYYNDGVFYRHAPQGYVVVTGPVGYRVTAIPRFAVKVRIGAASFYYYYGTYYRYDPRDRVYVVVSPEEERIRDVVVLADGKTYTGQFIRGDSRSIDFRNGDEVLEIPVRDIVSITFSPRQTEEDRG